MPSRLKSFSRWRCSAKKPPIRGVLRSRKLFSRKSANKSKTKSKRKLSFCRSKRISSPRLLRQMRSLNNYKSKSNLNCNLQAAFKTKALEAKTVQTLESFSNSERRSLRSRLKTTKQDKSICGRLKSSRRDFKLWRTWSKDIMSSTKTLSLTSPSLCLSVRVITR